MAPDFCRFYKVACWLALVSLRNVSATTSANCFCHYTSFLLQSRFNRYNEAVVSEFTVCQGPLNDRRLLLVLQTRLCDGIS